MNESIIFVRPVIDGLEAMCPACKRRHIGLHDAEFVSCVCGDEFQVFAELDGGVVVVDMGRSAVVSVLPDAWRDEVEDH